MTKLSTMKSFAPGDVFRGAGHGVAKWQAGLVVGRSTGTVDHPRLVDNGHGVFVSWLTNTDGYRLLPVR